MTEESKYTLQVKGIMNSQKRGLYLEIQHTIFLPLKGKKGTQTVQNRLEFVQTAVQILGGKKKLFSIRFLQTKKVIRQDSIQG